MKIVEKAKTITIGGPKIKLPKKGYTKIELKNVYTGEKQVYEDENMMTNAIEKYFANFGLMNLISSGIYDNTNIYNDLLGGIALFDGTLDEDPDNLYPYGVTMTANGCLSVSNSGNPTELGTYNPLKSGWIDGKWVQVYDWNQDHGNGNIACASLVSRFMGYYGFGNKSGTRVSSNNYSMVDDRYLGNTRRRTNWQNIAFRVDSDGLYHAVPKQIFKNGTTADIERRIRESSIHEINIQDPSKTISSNIYQEHNIWINMIDSYRTTVAGGKLYAFRHDNSYWTTSNPLVVVVIDDNHIHAYRINPPESNIYCNPEYCVFRVSSDGYVFIHKCTDSCYTRTTTVYKIKVDDGTLESTIVPSSIWKDYNPTASDFMKISEDVYASSDRIVNLKDDICLPINGYGASTAGLFGGALQILKDDNPLLRFSLDGNGNYLNNDIYYKGYRNWCYLASINNLATPVTKTSDKTMTVSYAVTFD